ncbi:MAG: alkaline phytoceramidase [Candidatus Latescibacterota bacterium]|nr:alkaline phytoceramidase [Candidatus Latescibacterota bacterium]
MLTPLGFKVQDQLMRLTDDHRHRVIASVVVALAFALLTRAPIAQDQAYHLFADQRPLFGIPNASNVLSNLGFLIVGLIGLRRCWCSFAAGPSPHFTHPAGAFPWVVFFVGLTLTASGSAYYHWAPSDDTLFWDRLPLSTTYTSLIAAVIFERVGPRQGFFAVPLLLVFGVGSVGYWHHTEAAGEGDLRYYLFGQATAVVLVPLMVGLLPARLTAGSDYLLAIAAYALAKLAEVEDSWVFSLGQWVSGHTLKHLFAAVAAGVLLRMLSRRSRITPAGALESPGTARVPEHRR